MSVYPYNLTPEGAPADKTGTYPNAAGYTPMTTGRRVAVALVDGVIGLAVGGITGYLAQAKAGQTWMLPVLFTIAGVYWLLTMWATFFKSSRVAGLLMGARYVDVRTGRLAGGHFFLKQMLQGLLAGLTFGIAPLIMVFASVDGPMRRNWFDRTTHLMLVDGRTGRKPGAAPDAPDAPAAASHVAAVQFNPEAAPTAWGGASGSSYEFPAVQSVTTDGGLITAVPGARPAAPQPAHPAPSAPPVATPAPLPVQQPPVAAPVSFAPLVGAPPTFAPPPSGLANTFAPPTAAGPNTFTPPAGPQDADRTILKPSTLEGMATTVTTPEITLDGAQTLLVSPPMVFGRNPVAPGSHPDAVPYRLDDTLVSKTHLLVGRDDEGVWVIDLNSTNGTSVAKIRGVEPGRITPGRKIRLPDGASVHFGQHRIDVG